MRKFYPIKVKDTHRETDEAVVVEFDIPEELLPLFKYTHGQHLTLRKIINGADVRRTYSICTAPSENSYQIAVKQIEGGKFSTFVNQELQAGDIIEVMPPQGFFFTELKPENKKRYVIFAIGSGITPIMSIIKTTLSTEPESEVILFYGNRDRKSVIFKNSLQNLKNTYMHRLSVHHIFTREQSDSELLSGRMDKDKIKQLLEVFAPISTVDEVFICGVHEVIFNTRETLEELGFDSKNVHFELFTSPDGDLGEKSTKQTKKSLDIAADESLVTTIIDGAEHTFTLSYQGKSILDTARENGADLPYSCKSGVCSTCKAKLVEGKVDMDANYALGEDEVEAGWILTCQSHPVTDKVKVDFDQV